MTYELINKCYNEILHRDVDPDGLKTYAPYIENGKTSIWLKKILRNSIEYKTKFVNEKNNKYAICWLCVNPNIITLKFAETLKIENYDIYICIDDVNVNLPKYDKSKITVLKISSKEAENNYYFGSVTYCKNRACSRDKALYYFTFINSKYDYIWFLEEDVFIPNKCTIPNIDNKYKYADLLSQANEINIGDGKAPYWQHWDRNKNLIDYPWAHSMICAVRVSKTLLKKIKLFVEKSKSLLFCEMLFNTIAFQNNLTILNPIELSNIIFQFRDLNLINVNINYLYHPIKNIKTHETLRIT